MMMIMIMMNIRMMIMEKMMMMIIHTHKHTIVYSFYREEAFQCKCCKGNVRNERMRERERIKDTL